MGPLIGPKLIKSWPKNDAKDESGTFEAIVVCAPARNALDITGIAECLDQESLSVLQRVRYDARTSHALFFDSRMAAKLQELFDNAVVDGDSGDCIFVRG